MSASIVKTQIDNALTTFYNLNDRYPKDHQEFMDQIVKANNLSLPVLYPNQEYRYNVEKHELMVVRK